MKIIQLGKNISEFSDLFNNKKTKKSQKRC